MQITTQLEGATMNAQGTRGPRRPLERATTAGRRSSAGSPSSWLAVVIGGAVGTKSIADEDLGNGESRQAEQIARRRRLSRRRRREVLVQSKRRRPPTTRSSAPRSATSSSGWRRSRTSPNIESPLTARTPTRCRADGRSALVEFELRGDGRADVGPRRGAAGRGRARRRTRTRSSRSRSSATRAPRRRSTRRFEEDFQRAEILSLPITLLILVVAFGALVAAGVPLLLGAVRRDGDARASSRR